MGKIKRTFRKAIGRPITNREHEMSRGIDGAMAYARFESVAMQSSVAHLPWREQIAIIVQHNQEWSAWLDAPYEPGKAFAPSYGRKEGTP